MFRKSAARLLLFFSCFIDILNAFSDTVPLAVTSFKYSLIDDGLRMSAADNMAANAFVTSSYLRTGFENRFCLKELMSEELAAVFRYGQNAFGLSTTHSGYRLYGDLSLAAGFSRTFGKHVAVGLRTYYLMTHAAECSPIHSFTFDVSLFARAGPNCGIGFAVYNPARLKCGVVGEVPLPVRLHWDFNYRIGNSILLLAMADWELKTRFAFSAGVKYRVKCLLLTAVARLPDPSGDVRIDLLYKRFLFGVSCRYLYPLGFVPRAEVTILL